jgi:catechol 2,3-dioxygenase-like lactoylglutathione lyase family enzyme
MTDHREFTGGRNIALKIPPHEYDSTLLFYRDTLGLRQLEEHLPSRVFEFGENILWLDQVQSMTRTEVWLELRTTNTKEAANRLEDHGVVRCDEIEKLPEGFDGFWISSPGKVVHLVHGRQEYI